MKTLWKLLFGKNRKASKPQKPKKQKKKLFPTLMEKLIGLPLDALERKWYNDLWNPNF